MGLKDTISNKWHQTDLMNDLISHLGSIGVNARLIDNKSPEAIHHSAAIVGNDITKFPRMATIKVEGRNVEFIEVVKWMAGGKRSRYWDYVYLYTFRTNVTNISPEIDAEFSMSNGTEGVSSPNWVGGKLAQVLGEDSELAGLIEDAGRPELTIVANEKDGYVSIYKTSGKTISGIGPLPSAGMTDFPNFAEFEIYDRIARHIRTLAPELIASPPPVASSKRNRKEISVVRKNNRKSYRTMIALVAVMGTCFLVFGIFTVLSISATASWPTTDGVVTNQDIAFSSNGKGGGSYAPVIYYDYQVDGQGYSSNQISKVTSYSSYDWAQSSLSKYPVGSSVTVHYNPASPSEAVLETDLGMVGYVPIVIGTVMILLCVLGAYLLRR